ncbi:Protein HAPLESS [Parasponia andersonii]|uniref:Protein HAPLESS n=1 Tax=Parasponia andersonii TaxID=3476 RepID=A0A2P5BFU6_PARAD|nr:Protein HAPLESS [Parasponia andersonii]
MGLVVVAHVSFGVQILSKSKLEKCEKISDSDNLNCTKRIVLNMAVPSGSSGGEASIVAEIVEVEENSTQKMQTLRIPPVLTVNKSAAYAIYDLTYIRDVSYKPEEYYVKTRNQSAVLVGRSGGCLRRVEMFWMKGKPNTAHCVRFPGDWFHVFSIGQRSLGFSVKIQVKTGSTISEVFVGPQNRTVTSDDNFLRVNLIGDFVGYTNIPSFEDFYLVIPRQADQNRIRRRQLPLYGIEGRFERINQHPNAGTHSFSIGVTEVLNSNLLIELRADDVEYVYQRSPGKIISINIPTFEALSQFGVATITTKNTGDLEASYGLTFDCSIDVILIEEQFFIMKSKEETTRSFKLYPSTDQAAKYVCAAILKDSDYNEVDRAECQFATTSTVLDNGSQSTPFHPPKNNINGFFDSIESIWNELWKGLTDFITGKTCRYLPNCELLHLQKKMSWFF